MKPAKYTENEVYEQVVNLHNKVLDKLYEYIDVEENVTDEVIKRYLQIFTDSFTPGIFISYMEYVTSIIGRQMNNPVAEGKVFVPTQEDYVAGYAHITGPQRYSLLTTYLMPLAMYATIYYAEFPFYLDPIKEPHFILNYQSYNDFRDNQTCVSVQARYAMIRKAISNEVLGFTDDEPSASIDENDISSKIEFFTFEGNDDEDDGGIE